MRLTVYSNNYDDYSYTVGHGMSGKVFLENGKTGREFRSVEQAIDFIVKNSIDIKQLTYCFQHNGQQYYKTFSFTAEVAKNDNKDQLSAT